MKSVFSLLFIFFASFTLQDESALRWSANRKLTWSDFRGTPDKYSEHSAVTTTILECNVLRSKEDTLYAKVDAVMERSESWAKMEDTSRRALMHEQTHFDICELYARKLRKEISQIHVSTKRWFIVKTEIAFTAIRDSMNAAQDKYDNETGFSGRMLVQTEWTKKINKQLEEHKAYSEPLLKVLYTY